MAYRKRRYTRRRPNRRYRRYGRRYKRRVLKGIHLFKRTKVDEHTLTNAGFVAIKSDILDATYNDFRLDQLPNYTEFTTLYDEYKICMIKQKFIFNKNSAEVASANAELPQLITVNDYNDVNALANELEALEYASFKSVRLDKPIVRTFRLRMDGLTNIIRSTWNPTHYLNCGYHGLKVAVDTISSAGGTTLGTLKVFTTFYMAMRNPK